MPAPAPRPPLVSVVMATYNRSNIIGYSIETVLRSTLSDWELLVIGDACTDDTADVVGRFADPRIRFVNLATNCGEQSGPNNEGARIARGRYLAFLNHDDLWLPDHLERSVAVLEQSPSVDLVFGRALTIGPAEELRLCGSTTLDGRYHPAMRVPASLWVMRRSLMDRVGPMRPAGELGAGNFPTREWLDRAARRGAVLRGAPHLAAVAVRSSVERDSYRRRTVAPHERWSKLARALPPEVLLSAALEWQDPISRLDPLPFFREGLRIAARRIFSSVTLLPAPLTVVRHWRKGSLLRAMRRRRGLGRHPDI